MKQYLGDGVYVRIDEYFQIELTTENGISVTNTVYLELQVLSNFLEYLKRNKLIPANFT